MICPANGDISGNQLERVPEVDANAYVRCGRELGDEFDEEYVTSSLALVGTGGARTMQYAPFMGEKRTVSLTVSAKF